MNMRTKPSEVPVSFNHLPDRGVLNWALILEKEVSERLAELRTLVKAKQLAEKELENRPISKAA